MRLSDSVSNVKGVGEKTAPKLNKLGISSVGDLIFDLPRGFMELNKPIDDPEEHLGELVAVKGKLVPGSVHTISKGKKITYAKILLYYGDSYLNKTLQITYFNAPYIAKSLNFTDDRIFYGFLNNVRGISLVQPKIYSVEEYDELLDKLQPVYGLTKGLSNVQLRKFIKNALDDVKLPEEYLSEKELIDNNMLSFEKAIYNIHFPENEDIYLKSRKRMVFHEFLTYFLETHNTKDYLDRAFDKLMIPVADTVRLIERLPYTLTSAQLRTWKEIEEDMCSGRCMNRMVQGDVGSGKTIIALLALLLNAANNHQGCLMAPTEVLAAQHYETFTDMAKKYELPVNIALLIGSLSASNKKQIKQELKEGKINIIIGTSALIQDTVQFKDLTLAITDEQHRFGVRQRELLNSFSNQVHVLVMSATPIPRSLAMTMFSGVSLSIIDELPANRLPIKNCVILPKSRSTAYKFIVDEVNKGHQAYVICPLVEESEGMDLENVIDYTDKLKEILPSSINIAYLHGKMRPSEKNKIMEEFAAHNIDVLVSTTVIEVGINVPNATVMMIENADRFGLASLHQVRGRVGRGDAQSYCIFINTGKSELSAKRLDILNHSNNGFYIADEDLKLRGPGELQGIRQTGDFGFVMANIYDDVNILDDVKSFSESLFESSNDIRLKEIISIINEYGFNPVDFRTI